MPGLARLLLSLACGSFMLVTSDAARAGAEWNPVRSPAVDIGPEASRLVVGFRATSANTVVKTLRVRRQVQSVTVSQAGTSDADIAGLVVRSGLTMARSRQLTPSMHVVFLQKPLYGAEVDAVLQKLRADPAVQFADIDRRRHVHSLPPDDPLFGPPADAATTNTSMRSGQWFMQKPSSAIVLVNGVATQDLSATDAISAWAITTGSTGTVIADVDTGVRFDHPDLLRAGLGGRLLPGYDFVGQDYSRSSGAALGTFLIANDGDGWDPDASDPGDWVSSGDFKNPLFPATECGDSSNNNGPVDSSWHGTRVVGVLGALTDNATGIAGMTWNSYILPVRALGKCGGYDSDIIAGMQWAAGMPVSGVPDNPFPADIINLSLGGTGACPSEYQGVIGTLSAMGVLVVASAGNGGATVDAPANCPGVLAVAGLRNVGTKVGYSSLGKEVAVSAPAGNCVNSSGACLRSIDTTYNTGPTVPSSNGYTDQLNPNLGTSFSAPIVSGIAALMHAVNANLTPAQLIARIESSSSPFPQPAGVPVCSASTGSGECACPNDGSECGAGMVNALSAVDAALNPIAVISMTGSDTFDAGASVAACHLTIASYHWTAGGGVVITSGSAGSAQVTVASGSGGTLALTVTDSANHVDSTASVSFAAGGAATVHAPSSAGNAASACPTPVTVALHPPTVSEAFAPSSVAENVNSILTVTFSNPNGVDLTQSGFTGTVPANLTIQASPAPTTTCGSASETLTNTASAVTMAGATIPANGSCSITMSVKTATAGSYTSTVPASALTTGPAGSNVSGASAILSVTAPASMTAPASKGGGGELDWWDAMFAVGVLLAGRRGAKRRPERP